LAAAVVALVGIALWASTTQKRSPVGLPNGGAPPPNARWQSARRADPASLTDPQLDELSRQLARQGNTFLSELLRRGAGLSAPSDAAPARSPAQAADALDLAGRLGALGSRNARVRVVLGLVDAGAPDAGSPQIAADALGRAFESVPFAYAAAASEARVTTLLAHALLNAGRYAEALELLPATADPETERLRGRAALGTGDIDAARRVLEHAAGATVTADFAVDSGPYAGEASCAACHPGHARTQLQSAHARTFPRGRDLDALTLPSAPLPDPAAPAVTHSYTRRDANIEALTRLGAASYSARVRFAFGSGRHGVTFVAADPSDRLRELRLSHYAALGWDRTTGHAPAPADAADFLGRPLDWNDLLSCLGCHTTVPLAARDAVAPAGLDRGIGCERCHGPGANHALAAKAKLPDLMIALPSGARASEITRLCGQCHRPPSAAAADPLSASAVRFQAATLPLSACYDPASSRLTCVTCHDPHAATVPSPAHFDRKCLECHATPNGAAAAPPIAKSCPVNAAADCVSCHMPRVPSATAHAVFTDHHIRVH
jgi:hypothetical protein